MQRRIRRVVRSIVWGGVGALACVAVQLALGLYADSPTPVVSPSAPVQESPNVPLQFLPRATPELGEFDTFMQAMRLVETGGEPDGGRGSVTWAQNGLSHIGPLQVGLACWKDARMATGTWADCHDLAYATEVAVAYWTRYCPEALRAGDWETLARTWYGGPRGARRTSTLVYWGKVRAMLRNRRSV
jgi:hypothetical protein